MSKKLSLLLTSAAASFAVITIFVGIPAIIYDTNPGEFSVPFLNIIGSYTLPAIIVILLLVLPTILLPSKLARFWSAVVAITAIYIWAHGVFQTHNFGTMDGQTWSAEVPTWQIVTEAAVICFGVVSVFFLAFRFQKMVATFVFFLAVGMLFQSWPLLSTSHWILASNKILMAEVGKFSDKKNALVILLDTMSSDVFEQVAKENPYISSAMDGFILYPDTIGASPTTYLALPTIHSGQVYEQGNSTADFFGETVKNHSVLSKIAKAGYQSTLINPIQNVCPNNVECLTAEAAMRSKKSVIHSEGIIILDALLFRIAPLGLKNTVYNQGEWVIQKWTEDQRFIQRAITHNNFLKELADSISLTADAPTLKFLHLMNTHPPYFYIDQCSYAGRQLAPNRDNFSVQVKCSLDNLVELIKSLKAHNIYDQTAIILLADHGNYSLASTRTAIAGNSAKIVGAANPTFAIKPINSKGAFRTAGGEIYIGDFGATLCDLTSACVADNGISALNEPSGRVRIFNYYKWKHEYWKAASLGDLVVYEIKGPISNTENWVKFPQIVLGRTIDFGDKGTSTQYMWSGWANPEPSGTWSNSATASLIMKPDTQLPIRLTIHADGFIEGGAIRATVLINGEPAGEMAFNAEKPSGKFSFDVAGDILKEDMLRVDFQIDEPKSPKDLNLSNDSRKLGIRMRAMSLDLLQP